jgi:hypothetical protein
MSGPPESELDRTKRMIRRLEDLESRSKAQEQQLASLYLERARLSGGIKLFYTPYVFKYTAPI